MARDPVALPRETPTVGDPVIMFYLAALADRLGGPRRARVAVLEEITDGLHEAIARHGGLGLPPVSAARAAVAEFGTPTAVAASFADELATAQTRRTVATLILTGPLVGVWWLLLLAPRPWRPDPIALWAAIPALSLIAVAVAAAAAVLLTTGRLTRWLPATAPRPALTVTTAVGLACIAGDLTVLGTLAGRAVTAPESLPLALAGAATTASLIRLSYAARAVHHSLRTRRTLG